MLNGNTLIIVACHAIWLGGASGGLDESEWLIEPFQVGETSTFIDHVRRGVQELEKTNLDGILTFSGGATRRKKTKGEVLKTEARGYMELAMRHNMFQSAERQNIGSQELLRHTFQEDYATDSYQNVLLSLLQYPIWLEQLSARSGVQSAEEETSSEITGLPLPRKLFIISHEFKRQRFLKLHLPAIRSIWPSPRAFDQMEIEFIGINQPFNEQKMKEIEAGDRKRGYGVWQDDLFGNSKLLSGKREERGWNEDDFVGFMKVHVNMATLELVKRLVRGFALERRLEDS